MNSSSMLLMAFFLAVAFVAGSMIMYHRYRLKKTRFEYQEPTLNSPPKTSSEYNRYADEENEFVDPVVGSALKTSTSKNATPQPTVQKSTLVLDSPRRDHQATANQNQATADNNLQATLFPQDLIIFNLLANKDRPYVGYELLQALLAAGLRFGKMQIFHRYQQLNGGGPIIFSMASIVEPGTFELSKMGGFVCPGLVMFLRVSQQHNLVESFELMLDTAHQLVDDLGGEICDERRQVLTDEQITEIRDRVLACSRAQIPDPLNA